MNPLTRQKWQGTNMRMTRDARYAIHHDEKEEILYEVQDDPG